MRTRLKHVSQWGFAVVVAAGLSFGARSALAAPLRAPAGEACQFGSCTPGSPPSCPDACIVEGWVLPGVCDPGTFCCECPE